MHDTTVDEWQGETVRMGYNAQQQHQTYNTNADDPQRNRSDTGNSNNNSNNNSARITALRQIFPTVKIGNAINSN